MPIDRYSKTSPFFFEPEGSIKFAKYVDITKFLSLIKDKKLFFCRLDKLEDRFEGTFPTSSKKDFNDFYKYMRDSEKLFKESFPDEKIEEAINDDFNFRNKLRSLYCVNCWNEFKEESYALWKIYSDLNQGIMIKSSFDKVIRAFSKSTEIIYCSKVKYIDYETDSIDIGNTITPIIHKHKAYSYENEIRLIHEVPSNGWNHDWENEEFENGIKIDVDLIELISEIVISPFSPNWFYDLIEDILEKYSIKVPIINSKLK